MTLTTRVAIFGHYEDIDPADIYTTARALVRTPPDAPATTDWDAACTVPGVTYLHTEPLSGADAWVIVRHAEGLPLPGDELDGMGLAGDWSVVVSFDTGHGYFRPDGKGPGAMHREYVAALMAWADERDFDSCWRDDYRREWSSANPTN